MLSCIPTAAGEAESAHLIWTVLLKGTYTRDACEYMVKGKVLWGSCSPSAGKRCWSRHLMLWEWFISTVTVGKDAVILSCNSCELHGEKNGFFPSVQCAWCLAFWMDESCFARRMFLMRAAGRKRMWGARQKGSKNPSWRCRQGICWWLGVGCACVCTYIHIEVQIYHWFKNCYIFKH